MQRRRSKSKRYEITLDRISAVSLLLVLATGLTITTFTEGWLTALPSHDHLFLGARALAARDQSHHIHQGDALDHAEQALQTVTQSANATTSDGRVVSLRAATAQVELGSIGFLGWVHEIVLPLPSAAGLVIFLALALLLTGRCTLPLAPPPRHAPHAC